MLPEVEVKMCVGRNKLPKPGSHEASDDETYASKQVFPTYQDARRAECILQRWSRPSIPACGRGNFYSCAVSSWSFPGVGSKIIMPLYGNNDYAFENTQNHEN